MYFIKLKDYQRLISYSICQKLNLTIFNLYYTDFTNNGIIVFK